MRCYFKCQIYFCHNFEVINASFVFHLLKNSLISNNISFLILFLLQNYFTIFIYKDNVSISMLIIYFYNAIYIIYFFTSFYSSYSSLIHILSFTIVVLFKESVINTFLCKKTFVQSYAIIIEQFSSFTIIP